MDKEELEQNVDYYAKRAKSAESHIIRQNERIAELKKENTALRQDWEVMKNTIADYNDFCDKYMRLEQENAELKAVERMALYSRMSDRLAKAEELLLELYDCIPSSMADSCKETLQKVALFFKDSEVEK